MFQVSNTKNKAQQVSSHLKATLCGSLFVLAFVFTMMPDALAQSSSVSNDFLPVRPMGMGGAFTAISNDQNAVWTNPAGIARIRKARSRKGFHILSFPTIAGVNSDGRSAYAEFKKITSSSGDDASVASAINEAASKLGEKPFWARAAFNPLAVFELRKGSPATFGMFTNNTTQMLVDPETSTADVKVISDTGINLGFGFSNRTNRMNFGFQLRPTYRYAFDDKVPVSTLIDKTAFTEEVKASSNNGMGTALDFGGMFTMADFWYPTIAFAVYNAPLGCVDDYLNPYDETRHKVCGTTFGGTVKNPEALSVLDPTDLRIGLSITPRLSRDLGLRFALDAHKVYLNSGDTYYGLPGIEASKLMHAGLELFFGNPLQINPTTFRVGYNQGFYTYGATIMASFITLEFASYGADISTSAKTEQDRRYLASLSFDF